MSKQQQKQLLLKQLIQRNQTNSQIIRKYIRKMSNFHKRSNLTSIFVHHSMEQVVEEMGDAGDACGSVEKMGGELGQELGGGGLECNTEIQKVQDNMGIQQKEIRNKECQQNQKQKTHLKLPSINPHLKDAPATLLLSPNRHLVIKSQISLSINPAQPTLLQKHIKVSTQATQPTRYLDQQLKQPNTSQSKQIKNLWKPNLQSFTHKVVNCGQAGSNSAHKRDSGSYKALLNLQEIVFQEGTKKGSKGNREHYRESRDKGSNARLKANCRDGDKLKKDKDKEDKQNIGDMCYSYHGDAKRLTSLDGLQSLANALGSSNTANNQYQSISISALTYVKTTIARNSTQAITSLPPSLPLPLPNPTYSTHQPLPQPMNPFYPCLQKATNQSQPKQSHSKQKSRTQKQSQRQKNGSNLPQLRKIKQLRFNIQKCRKQYNGSYTNIRNCYHGASQNCSVGVGHGNGSTYGSVNVGNGNSHNHSYSSGVADVFNSHEIGANAFKIQALPLQQIKWM